MLWVPCDTVGICPPQFATERFSYFVGTIATIFRRSTSQRANVTTLLPLGGDATPSLERMTQSARWCGRLARGFCRLTTSSHLRRGSPLRVAGVKKGGRLRPSFLLTCRQPPVLNWSFWGTVRDLRLRADAIRCSPTWLRRVCAHSPPTPSSWRSARRTAASPPSATWQGCWRLG